MYQLPLCEPQLIFKTLSMCCKQFLSYHDMVALSERSTDQQHGLYMRTCERRTFWDPTVDLLTQKQEVGGRTGAAGHLFYQDLHVTPTESLPLPQNKEANIH